MLTLAQFSVVRGANEVVARLDSRFSAGEFVVVLGPNGAGKTSFLQAIAGLIAHRGGLDWQGESITAMPLRRRAGLIGYLPQGHLVQWPLPVREIVALGRFPHGATDPRRLSAEDAAHVAAAMQTTGITALADRPADALSGGERARVAIARVLALASPIILVDEPTAALDPGNRIAVMETLAATARRGALVIAVTHDIDLAIAHATRILLIADGRVVGDDVPGRALTAERMAAVFGIRHSPGTSERLR